MSNNNNNYNGNNKNKSTNNNNIYNDNNNNNDIRQRMINPYDAVAIYTVYTGITITS